jgi:hypothetical protein
MSEGSGTEGVGGSEKGDHGPVESGGNVHGSGIVANDNLGCFYSGDHFGDGRFSAEVDGVNGGGLLGDLSSSGRFIGGTEQYGSEAELLVEAFDHINESFGRPLFGFPAGAGQDGGEGLVVGETGGVGFLKKATAIFGRKSQVDLGLGAVDAEQWGDAHVAVDGVDFPFAGWNFVGVEGGGRFASVGKADAHGGAGCPGQKAAAEEALEIDDEVELFGAEAFDEFQEFDVDAHVEADGAVAFAIEGNDLLQIGLVLEEIDERGGDEPSEVGIRIATAEQMQDGEGMNQIAQAGRLDDEDALKLALVDGAGLAHVGTELMGSLSMRCQAPSVLSTS